MAQYGVIFDMDGVLVDSYRAHFESWRRLAQAHGLDMTEEQFAATFGQTTREIIRRLWSEHLDDEDVARWDDEKEAYYRDVLAANFPEMVGAAELIASLHEAGFAMAIGSSGPPENVAVVMAHLRGAERIAATVDAMDVTRGKPDPEVFLMAAGKLGVEPRRCAVIEDAVAGVEAARRAGMAAFALTGTATREQLAAADLVVHSLRELAPEVVLELIAERNRQDC